MNPCPPRALNARKGEFYRCLYEYKNGNWVSLAALDVVDIGHIEEGLSDEIIYFCGEGAVQYGEEISMKIRQSKILEASLALPSGYGVAKRGMELYRKGDLAEMEQLVPTYIKRFQGVS